MQFWKMLDKGNASSSLGEGSGMGRVSPLPSSFSFLLPGGRIGQLGSSHCHCLGNLQKVHTGVLLRLSVCLSPGEGSRWGAHAAVCPSVWKWGSEDVLPGNTVTGRQVRHVPVCSREFHPNQSLRICSAQPPELKPGSVFSWGRPWPHTLGVLSSQIGSLHCLLQQCSQEHANNNAWEWLQWN